MSRVGKKPILIPPEVTVQIEGQKVIVKGPKGELSFEFDPRLSVVVENSLLKINSKVSFEKRNRNVKALWGLTRALIFNMVKGVKEGYEKKLELKGIGYKARTEGNKLILNVGFSHPVEFEIPEGISISVEGNVISVKGIDKQLVGEVAAKIRRIRPPEPYKGTGISYVGEQIRRKEIKKVTGGAA